MSDQAPANCLDSKITAEAKERIGKEESRMYIVLGGATDWACFGYLPLKNGEKPHFMRFDTYVGGVVCAATHNGLANAALLASRCIRMGEIFPDLLIPADRFYNWVSDENRGIALEFPYGLTKEDERETLSVSDIIDMEGEWVKPQEHSIAS